MSNATTRRRFLHAAAVGAALVAGSAVEAGEPASADQALLAIVR